MDAVRGADLIQRHKAGLGGEVLYSGWLDLNSVQIRHFSNHAVKQTGRN